jgi:hypothetical protein
VQFFIKDLPIFWQMSYFFFLWIESLLKKYFPRWKYLLFSANLQSIHILRDYLKYWNYNKINAIKINWNIKKDIYYVVGLHLKKSCNSFCLVGSGMVSRSLIMDQKERHESYQERLLWNFSNTRIPSYYFCIKINIKSINVKIHWKSKNNNLKDVVYGPKPFEFYYSQTNTTFYFAVIFFFAFITQLHSVYVLFGIFHFLWWFFF